MDLLPLLGKRLKDEDVIDVLEGMEMKVLYDFDRLHEGEPDKYWAQSKKGGVQFGFDAAQVLRLIFLHIVETDDFAAFSPEDCDVPQFVTLKQVEAYGAAEKLQVSKGGANFLGVSRDWVRLSFATHSVHYEFHGDNLALITISRNESRAV